MCTCVLNTQPTLVSHFNIDTGVKNLLRVDLIKNAKKTFKTISTKNPGSLLSVLIFHYKLIYLKVKKGKRTTISQHIKLKNKQESKQWY